MGSNLGLITKPMSGDATPAALTWITMNNIKKSTAIRSNAEGNDENGQCCDDIAVSIKTTLTFDGNVKTADNAEPALKAGDIITHSSKKYLVDSADLTSTAGGIQTFSVSAHRNDECDPTAYTPPTPAT